MIGCAACSYFIIYSLFLICRMPDVSENELDVQSVQSAALSRKSSTTDKKKEIEFSSAL